MANLREVTGISCISGNLGIAEWSERAIDRVAALGAAGKISPLGVDVFRWAYASDAQAAARVCGLLNNAIRARHQMPYTFADRIAAHAMSEFSDWRCIVCHGRQRLALGNGVVIECETCNATGLRRYTNTERTLGCGFDPSDRAIYGKLLRQPIELALELLRSADVQVNSTLNRELERTVYAPSTLF